MTYRIPALLALTRRSDGQVVLAFIEERHHTATDTGDIDVVMRRSHDGGRTWGDPVTVCDFGGDVCGNPAPVEDAHGRVHLVVSGNPAGNGELSGNIQRSVHILSSEDGGSTWTPPRDITAMTKQPTWQWYATGPGHGMRLQHQRAAGRNGRLVIPCDHSESRGGRTRYASHVIFSDDHGETWLIGGDIAQNSRDASNEASVAELGDGSLLLIARNYVAGKRLTSNRLVTKSADGGATWAEEHAEPALSLPDCQGSIVAVGRRLRAETGFVELSNRSLIEKADLVAFSHASRASRPWDRQDLRVSISTNGGQTWPADGLLVHKGPAGYSDLQLLRDGSLLVLFETGLDGVHVARLSPEALLKSQR